MLISKTFIIAEAGVNHNGSLSIAKKLIDVASLAGADAVKFQTFKTGSVFSKRAKKAAYQKKATNKNETVFDMVKKLELDEQAHKELAKYCQRKKIIFLSTPFDFESIELLNRLRLKVFKIPSGEITNLPYLRKIAALKKKVIFSTGMADLKEISGALNVLIKSGAKKKDIIVLHCNTEYPTPIEDVNLRAMLTIKRKFGIDVGYSDHTLGIEVSIAAVALGAKVIEKHFTLSRNMKGPDHKASLEPKELKAMVEAIRNIEKALGNGVKKASASELKNKIIARKCIVAAENIKNNQRFTTKNITVKRPCVGLSPMLWDKVMTKRAKKDFKKDEAIRI